uniref:Uncharacterized protein n=1 Tax=Arundo donax TaxID=35708 RepID=A0A0A9FAS4_ARUDO
MRSRSHLGGPLPAAATTPPQAQAVRLTAGGASSVESGVRCRGRWARLR